MKVELLGYTINLKLIILPLIYIIIGIIIFNIIKKLILKATNRKRILKVAQKQRIETLSTLILNIVKYIVVILVVLAILSLYGVNVKSILAGLGIGTAIIEVCL